MSTSTTTPVFTRRAGRRPATLAASLFVATALAGCASGARFDTANRYTEVYPIEVADAPVIVSVPADQPLSDRDARRVDALGARYLRLGAGRLTIAYPDDVDAAAAVGDVARRLHALGVPMQDVRRGAYDAAAYEGEGVVVSFDGPAARSTPCPALWGDSRLNGSNQNSGRFGCATQANLAAMVADPRDLVAPAPLLPPSSSRGVRVQRAFAAGDSTATANAIGGASTTD